MDKLQNGDAFPSITLEGLERSMTLPDDLEGAWSLIVFYRGHW